MGYGEEMGRVEERLNLQDVSSVITTSILEEMRGAEPLDAVTLVCKVSLVRYLKVHSEH